MKYFTLALVITIGAIANLQSAYADQKNAPSATGKRNQAEGLVTKPATINSRWNNPVDQSNNSTQTADSVVILREQGCKKINPLDYINNPDAFFQPQCQSANNQTPQSSEPVEYLKVPRLDSGLSVTVTKF
ncbi:hypothetical protein Cylst_5146 [Cylindrospermum stagnale PCC 7417]|uniref:Uncharacterized protein n=1 Tax=Cylindrospermum stagnale PCC 7417 TaxID=56107 RepID=K9X509_9NOST|nr:hypothetical protein [Cylindrospermum stagnale]AFZ27189.1 hypothetical protein Cylst_5146 [Cylindrospermum stagnale PCC 7417]